MLARTRDFGPVQRRALNRLWRQAANAALSDARAAIRAQGRGGGTHDAIAKALRVRIRSAQTMSMTIEVNTAKLTERQRVVARGTEKGRWRHPVFGDRDQWREQAGRPFFGPAMARHLPAIRDAAQKALNEAVDEFNRGTK